MAKNVATRDSELSLLAAAESCLGAVCARDTGFLSKRSGANNRLIRPAVWGGICTDSGEVRQALFNLAGTGCGKAQLAIV